MKRRKCRRQFVRQQTTEKNRTSFLPLSGADSVVITLSLSSSAAAAPSSSIYVVFFRAHSKYRGKNFVFFFYLGPYFRSFIPNSKLLHRRQSKQTKYILYTYEQRIELI
jgi:hypothetical protein